MEKDLVTRENVQFKPIPAAGLHGVGLLNTPHNLWLLFKGMLRSRQILRSFKPDVLFFTGGYVAVPMALAGQKTPSLLYVPDIEPGLALKFLSRFSSRLAFTTETSSRYFRTGVCAEVTGYPTRPGLARVDKASARASFGIGSGKPVLFIFGGSKGARSINQALWKNLPGLLAEAEVIHITGSLDWPRVDEIKATLDTTQAAGYHAFPYLHEEMASAFSAADLVICRAGASTLGELPLFGLPAILVPYPYAWRYQKVNADYLAGRGAARVIRDDDLAAQMLPAVRDLFGSPEKLAEMSAAASAMAAPRAASNLADLLVRLADSNPAPQVKPC